MYISIGIVLHSLSREGSVRGDVTPDGEAPGPLALLGDKPPKDYQRKKKRQSALDEWSSKEDEEQMSRSRFKCHTEEMLQPIKRSRTVLMAYKT